MTNLDPFADIRRALSGDGAIEELSGVRIDDGRRTRTGAPEVIYCKGKQPDQIVTAIRRLTAIEGRALAARVAEWQEEQVTEAFAGSEVECTFDAVSRTMVAALLGRKPPNDGGRVGVITAGSSDRAQAGEALAVLREMGCDTQVAHDVGIAGLHRLVQPLTSIVAFDPDVLIVAAGMDGVLPGVVSGLVSIPIVGLPTSTGYGLGGDGIGALTTMLQVCAPGVAVVNIDNGIGAGVMAGLIANRAAAQRSASS